MENEVVRVIESVECYYEGGRTMNDVVMRPEETCRVEKRVRCSTDSEST